MTAIPLAAILAGQPPIADGPVRAEIRRLLAREPDRKVIVLDDDPTGTQTVYDVPVLTVWDRETLARELDAPQPCFYVLTNSRSMSADAARALNLELGRNLRAAARGRPWAIVSRGDSTLRGHFPAETDALDDVLGPFDATFLLPYFEAGGRVTIDDVHYLLRDGQLTPVAETPFARDATFGYSRSNLREWVEEKTGGRVRAAEVHSIGLAALRESGPGAATRLATKLRALPPGAVCVVNAAAPQDVECFALAALLAEQAGGRFLYRTAAQFVAARIGLEPRPLLSPADFAAGSTANGGLVIVGSHVPQSTEQLHRLLAAAPHLQRVELAVAALARDAAEADALTRDATAQIDAHLADGRDVVVFTSRALLTGRDAGESLQIAGRVSRALWAIAAGLKATPRFLIAKGGITSSDIATKGLAVRRAMVRGQIERGVPVWRLGAESRFPGMDYVVFPGNVGGPAALAEVHRKLSQRRS